VISTVWQGSSQLPIGAALAAAAQLGVAPRRRAISEKIYI